MANKALSMDDLVPKEADLVLSSHPGKTFTLKKITLFEQLYIRRKYGEEMLGQIFTDLRVGEISEIAYYLLKDKADFPSIDDFQTAIVTSKDRVNLIAAMFETVGVSQPIIDKLNEEEKAALKKKAQAPKKPIGEKSSI